MGQKFNHEDHEAHEGYKVGPRGPARPGLRRTGPPVSTTRCRQMGTRRPRRVDRGEGAPAPRL